MGRTGAGKSTISNTLSRIVELEGGSIAIDGVDIAQVDLSTLRQKVTVISQDPVLFKGTLRFNLDPFNEVSEEAIERLCKRAGLGALMDRAATAPESERGINLMIAQGGENLSQGEKQLVCICRAALRKSKIVVLDEATANIDVNTETQIQKLIAEEFEGCTVITIAHRLNTIIKSDRVLVLSHGSCLEYGAPAELAADETSEFAKLLENLHSDDH